MNLPLKNDLRRESRARKLQRIPRCAAFALVLLATSLVAGCEEPTIGVPITGIDHLPEHMSVQRFYVDGYDASRAGAGGRTVCCALLPRRWRPDLAVEIRWNVTNWRDCDWMQHVRRVPVERYEEVGSLYVHFLADGNVRAVSSNYWPEASRYPGPHDRIPSKEPWRTYGWDDRCNAIYKGEAPRLIEDSRKSRP